jgi:hypothetical protein
MATIKSVNTSIERNSFDYARAFAEAQSQNPTIISELEQAYTLISQNLGISAFDFIQILKSKGDGAQQSIYLAAQLNSVRPRNSVLGISLNQNIPLFISREIGA